MASLTPEQRRVAAEIVRIARRRGESPMEEKAAIATGLVETNLRNLPGGDADSAGWRQERASIYKDPTNLSASINRFFDETSAVQGKYKRAGDLAAAVQRPAAQYRGRYQQRSGQADAILRMLGDGGGSPRTDSMGGGGGAHAVSRQAFDQAGFDQAGRVAALGQFLQKRNPNNFLLRVGAVGTQAPNRADFTSTVEKMVGGGGGAQAASAGSSDVAKIASEANRIDQARVPYKWGGGHGAPQPRGSKVTPLDCSGAVSRALGVNPKVSGDFAKWGASGRGKRVTIYANPEHVLMEIDGHFWGTSASNPRGGAGWIARSQISPEYLSRFTARHPPGQ